MGWGEPTAEINCVHFRYKSVVAESLVEHINPIRLKIDDYLKNKDYLCSVLDEGTEKARKVAAETMDEVKLKVGLGSFNETRDMKEIKRRN